MIVTPHELRDLKLLDMEATVGFVSTILVALSAHRCEIKVQHSLTMSSKRQGKLQDKLQGLFKLFLPILSQKLLIITEHTLQKRWTIVRKIIFVLLFPRRIESQKFIIRSINVSIRTILHIILK